MLQLDHIYTPLTFQKRCTSDSEQTSDSDHLCNLSFPLTQFNPPLKLRPRTHPSLVRASPTDPPPYEAINSLTGLIKTQLSSGTIDAPSWEVVRVSKTAGRMYAPLGTRMTLGDWVRVVRTFVGGFALERWNGSDEWNEEKITSLKQDLIVCLVPPSPFSLLTPENRETAVGLSKKPRRSRG